MNTNVILELLNENSIGRYFQLAALSVAYPQVGLLSRKIEVGILENRLILTPSEFNRLFKTIVDYLAVNVCPTKASFTPKLYGAGKGDSKILSDAGILKGKTLTCTQLVDFYGQSLLSQKLGYKVASPMFLRTYVYSRYRGRGEVEDTTVDSLYLALLGMFISAVGKAKKGDEVYELYVIPDSSLGTLRDAHRFYYLLNEPGSKVKLPGLIESLLGLEGISLELSTLLAMALYVYHVAIQVHRLSSLVGYFNIFERFRIVCLKPEDRPLVVWEKPLTLTHILQALTKVNALDLLDSLESALRHAKTLSESSANYDGVISSCVNDLYAFMESKTLEPLVHCVGGLNRLCDELEGLCREGQSQACTAYKVVSKLAHRVRALV